MSKKDTVSPDDALGCGLSMWSLCVTSPMYLVLMFAILQMNSTPTWAWVLYWVYVPSVLIGSLLAGLFRALKT